MKFEFSPELLDSLLPFSFIANEKGSILVSGRSLKKLFPTLQQGTCYSEFFNLVRPNLGAVINSPSTLCGELVLLEKKLDEKEVRLRGQVEKLSIDQNHFLFLLAPAIGELQQVPSWGLNLSDFAKGDPVFDFLILIQMQKQSQSRTEAARAQLAWENKVAQLLHDIVIRSNNLTDPTEAIRLTLEAICKELNWKAGHAYLVQIPERLIPSGIWYFSQPSQFKHFKEVTQKTEFRPGQGLPGVVFDKKEVTFVDNRISNVEFPRKDALQQEFHTFFAAGVPVIVHGEVFAILEFFTELAPYSQRNLKLFFDILGLQLGGVVAKQRALMKEKEQLAIIAQASKMSTLGEIAAGVAHEINNPLTTISLNLQQLSRLSEPPGNNPISPPLPVDRYLERSMKSVERIAKIVSGLKLFSREASRDPFQSVPVARIIEETLDLCQSLFKNRGTELKVVPTGSELLVQCRPSQISQVLLNLFSNSLDAIEGTPTPWIKIEAQERDEWVDILCTDSGQGIPEEVAKKMMSPFFTTKPIGKGTGLGLSISAKILEEHHGRLRYEPGSPNTCFILTLPKKQREQPGAL